ncbi:MAG: ammonia-forming cytochrome c nitrite reductase subunit c552, partial [Planctomycetota bacterium]
LSDWRFEPGATTATSASAASNKLQVDSCARCHARRGQIHDDAYTFGDDFLDHHHPSLMISPLYHPDGQILDEDYVYGSFLQSAMYHAGVTCADCHDVHSTRTHVEGNALCARCHLPSTYDTPEHHFHPTDSTGASCADCHMPETVYMGVDWRRDHSMRVPRPDLSLRHGTPNACTTCHSDQDDAWASEHFRKWYGDLGDDPTMRSPRSCAPAPLSD